MLKDQEAVKQLASILKTNVRACKALGHPYVMQLGRIYLDMLNVYKVSTCFIVKTGIYLAVFYCHIMNCNLR